MKVKFPDGTELALASLPRRTSLWLHGAKRWKMEFPFPEADLDAVYAHMAGGDLQTLDGDGAVLNTYERYTLSPEVLVKNGQATLALVQDDFAEVQEAQVRVEAANAAKAQAEAQAAAANTALAYAVGENVTPGEGAAAEKATAFRKKLGVMLEAAGVAGETALLAPEVFPWFVTNRVWPEHTILRYKFEDGTVLVLETDQEIDTVTHPDWAPEGAPALYKTWHGTSMETAQPYSTFNNTPYSPGEWCIFEGRYYMFINATSGLWSPAEYAAAWEDKGVAALNYNLTE